MTSMIKNLDNVKFVRENSMPAVGEYLAAKYYVEKAILKIADELTLVRNNHNNSFNDSRWTNKNSITFNPQAVHDNQVILKSYVDQFHQRNERSRRDLGIDFSTELSALANDNQDKSFSDYKLTHLNSITYKMFRSSDYELASRKFIDDAINEIIILRFNQTLQVFLKVRVRNYFNNLPKIDRKQITDISLFKYPNKGGWLLLENLIKCNDKNNIGKMTNFL